jgi:hypothetical protein
MRKNIQRALQSLDLEERILNGATVAALVFLFFPWLSGQFLGGDPVSYSGLQFYVSYIGVTILLLHVVILLITFLPLFGGPSLVHRSMRATVRMWIAFQAAVLTVASLSVLTRVTYEFRGLELRYGVYFSLVCSLIAALYAFLQWQEERRNDVPNQFHHPEDHVPAATAALPDVRTQSVPPPPPPPPPMRAEDHHLRM